MKKKTEKYIREITTPAGTAMLKIEIRAYDQSFRKSLKVSDFPSKKIALEAAKQIRDDALVNMRQGYTVTAHKIPTVEDLFYKSDELLPVRVATKKRHGYLFKETLKSYGNVPITKITAADIQKVINSFAAGHSKKRVHDLLSIWRKIYKTCALLNINVIDRTVAVTIPECQEAKHHKKEISPEDLETFCDALLSTDTRSETDKYRNMAIYYGIQIMKYCGLRPAEAFALSKEDINLISGYISVNKAAHSTITKKLDIGRTKTEKSIRSVPIPSELRPILIDCLAWSKNETLLSGYFGDLLSIEEINQIITKVKKRVGVEFNLYMLRHQFSTDLFAAGIAPAVIRDLMGHESATMSLDYATSKEEDRRQAINDRRFS